MPQFHPLEPAVVSAAMSIPASLPQNCKENFAAVEHWLPGIRTLASSGCFSPVPTPRRGDWLREHVERGQTFAQYLKRSFPIGPHGKFTTIVIVALGEKISESILSALREYVSSFFLLNVVILGPVPLDQLVGVRSRINDDTHQLQLFAGDCMTFVSAYVSRQPAVSSVACAVMGITLEDLTNREDWNFVYGLASTVDGMGVFSLARFSPEFCGEPCSGPEERAQIILERCCKVVSHELGHIFGLKHCIYFHCLMNGANHAGELNSQRLLECPACLMKLTHSFGWNILDRYAALQKAMKHLRFDSYVTTVDQLVGLLRAVVPSPLPTRLLGSAPEACDEIPSHKKAPRSVVPRAAARSTAAKRVC